MNYQLLSATVLSITSAFWFIKLQVFNDCTFHLIVLFLFRIITLLTGPIEQTHISKHEVLEEAHVTAFYYYCRKVFAFMG